jgi:hypothetical protein
MLTDLLVTVRWIRSTLIIFSPNFGRRKKIDAEYRIITLSRRYGVAEDAFSQHKLTYPNVSQHLDLCRSNGAPTSPNTWGFVKRRRPIGPTPPPRGAAPGGGRVSAAA